jgi:hypothetical protein
MGRTVGELLDSLDAAELVQWFAYYDIDPWTENRDDWRMGMMASVFANVMTGSKHMPQDFTPVFKAAETVTEEVDQDLLKLQGMKWAGMLGGKLKRNK